MNSNFTIRAYDLADLSNDWSGIGMYARVNRLKTFDPELKTLLSVGGWSFGTQLFKQMSRNKTGRSTFINSAIKFVRDNDFDGIDIDWEYPKGAHDILSYSLFIKELREAMNLESSSNRKRPLLLTVAVSAGETTIRNAYDIPQLAKHVDFVLLMSYDFHGGWETKTNLHNALYSRGDEKGKQGAWNIDWAANYWAEKGMPRRKIIIGIATYGRGWTLKDAQRNGIGSPGTASTATRFIGESGIAAYYELCEMLANRAQRYWEPRSQVPYLVYGDQWFTYDDTESIKNKMAWLKRQHFGGAFVWTLDFDDFNGRCSSSNSVVYPLVGVIARELAGIDITHFNVAKLSSYFQLNSFTTLQPPTLSSTTKPLSATSLQKLSPNDEVNCRQLADGFHPLSASTAKFILCAKGKQFVMNCPEGFRFDQRLLYCTENKTEDSNSGHQSALTKSPAIAVKTTPSNINESFR
ncbi:putative endochitinase [Toxocara canis]|uniref:Putative endochitinase n=1 Tax=Toxocara canis TaxID=6265 RepID=A0A0B2V5U4_TOXCA|nr:putative endochitinase [Toxocara canis]